MENAFYKSLSYTERMQYLDLQALYSALRSAHATSALTDQQYAPTSRPVAPPAYHSAFSIDAASEVLELKTSIDRENCSFLTVGIKATQQDNDLKTADTIVLVTIQDVNVNPSEFPQSSYMVSVPENSPDGTIVLQLTATNKDEVKARDHLSPYFEAHSTIPISLLDENDNMPAFEGTPSKQQIFFNMTAGMPSSGGMVPRSSSVPVQVSAVGDSRPRFIHKTYDGTLEEELNSPVPVTKVEFVSVDPHIPVTLQVLTESATFDVDINGTIWTKTKLDYESQKSHEINVSLTDGKMTDYAAVFIKITDINDNSPVFNATTLPLTC